MPRLVPAGVAATIENTERRSTITEARVTRETRTDIEITDGRSRAKRATKVIDTAKRTGSEVNMKGNIAGRASPSKMMIHLHLMTTTRTYVDPPFLARRSRCTLKRMTMIWCEKRQGKNCCGS